jgi:hypothetical protein
MNKTNKCISLNNISQSGCVRIICSNTDATKVKAIGTVSSNRSNDNSISSIGSKSL